MNSQSICIFLAVAEHKSISDAARSLFFSQSAVSQSLNQLEKELGLQLVVRKQGSRSIKLTPAGEAFVPLAKRQQELDAQVLQFVRLQTQKSIRIATNATAHQYLMPEIVQNLMQHSADLDLQLTSKKNADIPAYVASNLCDIAFFTGTAPTSKQFTATPFFQSEICILCSAETSLPERAVSPAELDPRFEITHEISSRAGRYVDWHRQHFPDGTPPLIQTSTFMSIAGYLTDPRRWAAIPLLHALFFVSRNPTKLSIRHIDPVPYYETCYLLISNAYLHSEIIDDVLQCCRKYLDSRPYLINCLPQ